MLTLLGVREDGVASIVDLVPDGLARAKARATVLLDEHPSCKLIEVWREAALVVRVRRD